MLSRVSSLRSVPIGSATVPIDPVSESTNRRARRTYVTQGPRDDRAQLLALPGTVDLVTAGRALGLGRSKSYALAQAGEWPTPLLRLGHGYRVPTAELLRLLGVEPRADGGDAA